MSAESVFICYRRDDSGETAGRIFDRLTRDLPAGAVFRDLDSIPLGVDFREHVRQKLASARVVLVLIGREWLAIRDAHERRRLDDAADHVRVEVELALHTPGVRVIPILCRQALMPGAEDLPQTMRDLAFKNGQAVRPDPDFHRDVDHLVKHIREILAEPPKKMTAAPSLEKNPAAEKDASRQEAAGAVPTKETKVAAAPTKATEGKAKQAMIVLFVLAFWGLLLWGGLVLVKFGFEKLGEGITWAKSKFATPTPAPGGLFDPRRVLVSPTPRFIFPASEKSASELLKDFQKAPITPTPSPTLSLSERIRQITAPTPTQRGGMTDLEMRKLLGKPTPTPTPFVPFFPSADPPNR